MTTKRKLLLAGIIGAVVAVAAVLANEQVDRYTSTDAFCGTSCHSMQAHVANDPVYVESAHRTAPSGVRAGCADCHIPHGILPATWAHVKGGIKDIISESLNDFTDKEVWERGRAERAHQVRTWLLETDSATCRTCHEEAAIQPERTRGQRQHADALERGLTCIGCHYNIVHPELEPRPDFLEQADKGR
jgi:nitrate/TMAO reductase-like tetraheme cytochrome c subunit